MFTQRWSGILNSGWLYLMALTTSAVGAATPVDAQNQQVGVITLEESEIPFRLRVPGRAVAFETAFIRPQISGIIDEVLFQPGAHVEAGHLLFTVQSATFEADVAAAEAGILQARSALVAAERNLDRYRQLETRTVTRAQVEAAEVEVLSSTANLRSAEAAHEIATLQLQRTNIASPISGTTSVLRIAPGTVVAANQQDPLAQVVRLDPIYVDVSDSIARVLEVRNSVGQGELVTLEQFEYRAFTEDGAEYGHPGELVAQDPTVAATTGTTRFRLKFANPDRLLFPGQFLRVDATLGNRSVFLVPQRAATREPDGRITVFLIEDGVARKKTVEEQGSVGSAWVVTDGLPAGSLLAVEGLGQLRDGVTVETLPVTLNASGVTQPANGE